MVSHKLARRQNHRPQEERGQVIVLMVLMMVVLLGFAALVIDVGYAYYAHRSLQNPRPTQQHSPARRSCRTQPGRGCRAPVQLVGRQQEQQGQHQQRHDDRDDEMRRLVGRLRDRTSINAVVVMELAPTKTFFAGLLGIPAFTIKAKATAAMRGGTPKPAHVMIVFDRTGSMGTACTIGGTKLDCAKSGINAFLGAMDPAYDKVGLVAFAPHSGNVCATPKTTNGAPSDYDAYPNNYLFVPLSKTTRRRPRRRSFRPRRSSPRSTASRPAGPRSSRPRSTRRARHWPRTMTPRRRT